MRYFLKCSARNFDVCCMEFIHRKTSSSIKQIAVNDFFFNDNSNMYIFFRFTGVKVTLK